MKSLETAESWNADGTMEALRSLYCILSLLEGVKDYEDIWKSEMQRSEAVDHFE